MKRLISILCAAALALSLVGCGAAGDAGGAAANDSYSLEDAVTFTFRDGGITAQGGSGGYEIDGTALTIDGAGAYVVTGSCADGSITVTSKSADRSSAMVLPMRPHPRTSAFKRIPPFVMKCRTS